MESLRDDFKEKRERKKDNLNTKARRIIQIRKGRTIIQTGRKERQKRKDDNSNTKSKDENSSRNERTTIQVRPTE
jgi:hypothetical protein